MTLFWTLSINIYGRNLYTLLGEVDISGSTMNAATCQKNLLNLLKKEETFTLEEEDIVVCRKKVGSLGDQKLEEKVRLIYQTLPQGFKVLFPEGDLL